MNLGRFQHPDKFSHHKTPMMSRESSADGIFVGNIQRGLAKATKNWPGFVAISAKIAALEATVFEKVCDAYLYSTENFTVLLHGDLWVNNLLFKYNADGDVADLKLVSIYIIDRKATKSDKLLLFGRSISQSDHSVRLKKICCIYCTAHRIAACERSNGCS